MQQLVVIPGPHPAPSDAEPGIRFAAALSVSPEHIKRLKWRCRRGTRELDALLSGWLGAHVASMDDAQFAVFDALLGCQDPELWDWLMGHAEPPRAEWRAIVVEIRQRAGLAP